MNRINFQLLSKVIGLLLLLESFLMLLALPFSLAFGPGDFGFYTLFSGKDDLLAIIISVLITVAVGLVMVLSTRKADTRQFGKKEGFIIVTFSWIVLSVFGSLPYMFSGVLPSFTDAYFETVSGLTTTGLSTIKDVEVVPRGILFWRSMTNWIGGMGIVVMSLAILPMVAGSKGSLLFAAETSNDVHDKVHPRVKETAKMLWVIYLGFSFACCILLLLGRMPFFDAVCLTLSTLATGGFSIYNTSLANVSPYIQYVVIIFMFLAATSFNLHYMFFKGQWKKVFKNEELKVYSLIILVVTVITAGVLIIKKVNGVEESFRFALFEAISILTTTGFSVTNFLQWPCYVWCLLFLISFICGCSGSTTGGIKVFRHIIMFKNCRTELSRQIHPQAVIPVRYNNNIVSQNAIGNILAFFYFFTLMFLLGAVSLMLLGSNFTDAMGAIICCLSNIGSGIGDIAGFGDGTLTLHPLSKWIMGFLMIIGRLELFTVLVLFNKSFWKK